MKHSFALLLTVLFALTGCMNQEGGDDIVIPDSLIIDMLTNSPGNNNAGDSTGDLAALRSYSFGVLPLTPDSPDNHYLSAWMEVSVNAIEKEGGVAVIAAGYPNSEGRIMNDTFITSMGDAYQLDSNHFSTERKVIDPSQVEYSIRAKENKTGKTLVFFVEVSDYGMTSEGKPYYNKALIVIEQAG